MIRNPSKQSLDLDELFRRFIRGVLVNRVLTQEELAHLSGLSRSGIAHWLAGRRSMTLRNASRLMSLFGYERMIRHLIAQTAGPNVGREVDEPDLVELLAQISVILKRQLHASKEDREETRDEMKDEVHE